MTSNPLPAAVDLLLEATVAGSFSRLGYEARRRLDDWEDARPTPSPASASCSPGRPRASAGRHRSAAGPRRRGARGRPGRATDHQSGGRTGHRPPERHRTAHIAELADLSAVRELADDLVDFGEPLDAVVHNAGALLDQKTMTVDGLETTLAVHVVAPHLLTTMLVPLLRQPARVVWVTSGGMYSQGLDVDHLEMDEDRYKGATQYARAKRAQVELLRLWAERLAPTAVAHAMHPGWADTPASKRPSRRFARSPARLCAPRTRAPTPSCGSSGPTSRHRRVESSGSTAASARPCTSPAPPRPTRNASVSGLGSRTEPGAESGRAVPAESDDFLSSGAVRENGA